ncbi:MAG: MFS transporter, partial [Pseudomonadota bacterium]
KQGFHWRNFFSVYSRAFENKFLKILLIVMFCTESAWFLYSHYVPMYVNIAFRYVPHQIGALMSTAGGIYIFSVLVIIRILLRYMQEKKLLITSLSLMLLGVIFISLFPYELSFWFNMVPLVVGDSISYVTILSLFSNVAGIEEQGWVLGVARATVSLARMFGSLLTFGVLISLRTPFFISLLLVVIALMTFTLRFRGYTGREAFKNKITN